MTLLALLLAFAPPVDLIDPWQRRGEEASAGEVRGELRDPFAVPRREPAPPRAGELKDPWAQSRERADGAATEGRPELVDPFTGGGRESTRSSGALKDPWRGAPRATPGGGHGSRRGALKDPYARRP